MWRISNISESSQNLDLNLVWCYDSSRLFRLFSSLTNQVGWQKTEDLKQNSQAERVFLTYSPNGLCILSQSYNATVFYFDNISFLAHVLVQLFLPNESSVSQASYRTMVLKQSVSNCSRNKPFHGGGVVEKKKMKCMVMYQYPTCDMYFVHRKG